MPEDETNGLNAEPTNPPPFEEFVRQHLALLLKAQTEMREKQDWMQKEMVERFVQLSQQIAELSARVDRVEERLNRTRQHWDTVFGYHEPVSLAPTQVFQRCSSRLRPPDGREVFNLPERRSPIFSWAAALARFRAQPGRK